MALNLVRGNGARSLLGRPRPFIMSVANPELNWQTWNNPIQSPLGAIYDGTRELPFRAGKLKRGGMSRAHQTVAAIAANASLRRAELVRLSGFEPELRGV